MAREVVADLLGPAGSRTLAEPPVWPSDVADDHTPVEYSIAFNHSEPPTLRILGEALGSRADPAGNLSAAHHFLDIQARRFGLSMHRFDRVRDLFAAEHPFGGFSLWHSIVFRHGRLPEFKVYFNPEQNGIDRAPDLVAEALRRLGLARSYRDTLTRIVRPGQLGRADRLTFFALDLHDGAHARVKLYLSHHDAEIGDVARAARVVDGVDPDEVFEFCRSAGGGRDVFAGRPLVGSYSFLGRADRPAGYSLYLPIRGYVDDDEQARRRTVAVLDRYGFEATLLDRAIAALTGRPLAAGRGLIAHVSLRLGPPRPGVTVYLSAEAYRVQPPVAARPAVPRQRSAPSGARPTDYSMAIPATPGSPR